ncbi:N-glycosylation protein EOS1 [Ceraceosorus bombacis]|uniref:N-glycosylation protein EOS1 n=1 Tax=Ceraceosorus bombacis TaxID=401625 RepID=A0A0N7LB35_9BASI|nr:N-glycosylation protein EOS1 [Ceraceosorus bombacis]
MHVVGEAGPSSYQRIRSGQHSPETPRASAQSAHYFGSADLARNGSRNPGDGRRDTTSASGRSSRTSSRPPSPGRDAHLGQHDESIVTEAARRNTLGRLAKSSPLIAATELSPLSTSRSPNESSTPSRAEGEAGAEASPRGWNRHRARSWANDPGLAFTPRTPRAGSPVQIALTNGEARPTGADLVRATSDRRRRRAGSGSSSGGAISGATNDAPTSSYSSLQTLAAQPRGFSGSASAAAPSSAPTPTIAPPGAATDADIAWLAASLAQGLQHAASYRHSGNFDRPESANGRLSSPSGSPQALRALHEVTVRTANGNARNDLRSYSLPQSTTTIDEPCDLPPPYTPSRPVTPPRSSRTSTQSHSRNVSAPVGLEQGERGRFLPTTSRAERMSPLGDDDGLSPPPPRSRPPHLTEDGDEGAGAPSAWVMRRLLHPLRLLAAVPGSLGTFWLLRNAVLCLIVNGCLMSPRSIQLEGPRQPSAAEFLVSTLWSISTAYHALSFTTLLLRRWLAYYALPSSVIRLMALQAICWPLVRLTLFIFGPRNPVGAWVVIGTTTAFSDTVARWVTSNIADAPEDFAGHSLAGSTSGTSTPTASSRSNRRARREPSRRFWRAIMGAPSSRSVVTSTDLSGGLSQIGPLPTSLSSRSALTESEWESDAGLRSGGDDTMAETDLDDDAVLSAGSFTDDTSAAGLRRRRPNQSGGPERLFRGNSSVGQIRRPTTQSGRRHRSISSGEPRRVFHWDVAMRRNVLPIALLGYVTMWTLLADTMKSS